MPASQSMIRSLSLQRVASDLVRYERIFNGKLSVITDVACWGKGMRKEKTIRILLRISILWWLLLLEGCATNPFANLNEWKEIQSKNFIVYTNASDNVAIDVVKEFEAFRATALKIITIPELSEEDSVRVYLFKSEHSFASFRPRENIGGYFIPEKNYIAIYALPFEENPEFPVVYHEYIHYLTSKHSANIPQWYDEGLATLFETFKVDRGLVTFGKAQLFRWDLMKYQAEWIPMDEFLSGQTSFYHNKGFTHAHSQAWALMHYFFYGNRENPDKLGQYLYMVNNGYEYDQALQSTFELTPEGLLQEVKNYIEKETLPFSTMKLNDIVSVPPHRIRSLEKDEAQQVIQELLDAVKEAFQDASLNQY